MVCKSISVLKYSSSLASFILTKWYVNGIPGYLWVVTDQGFILTKWYVIFDICTLFKLKGIGFILTK